MQTWGADGSDMRVGGEPGRLLSSVLQTPKEDLRIMDQDEDYESVLFVAREAYVYRVRVLVPP